MKQSERYISQCILAFIKFIFLPFMLSCTYINSFFFLSTRNKVLLLLLLTQSYNCLLYLITLFISHHCLYNCLYLITVLISHHTAYMATVINTFLALRT